MPDGTKIPVYLQRNGLNIENLYTIIMQKYPHIPKDSIYLQNQTRILDPNRTLNDYGIN